MESSKSKFSKKALKALRDKLPRNYADKVIAKMKKLGYPKPTISKVYRVIINGQIDQQILKAATQVAKDHQKEIAQIEKNIKSI